MSGIFFTVTEETRNPDKSIIRPTRGGYPHVTLVYTGKKVGVHKLSAIASDAFITWMEDSRTGTFALPKLVLTSENAHINSFYEERSKSNRFDVLLGLTVKDIETVKMLRTEFVGTGPETKEYSMHPPHVTHSIHYTRKDAEAALASICAEMPITVMVTGYTID